MSYKTVPKFHHTMLCTTLILASTACSEPTRQPPLNVVLVDDMTAQDQSADLNTSDMNNTPDLKMTSDMNRADMSPDATPDMPTPTNDGLAQGLHIKHINAYQSIQLPLMKDGQVTQPDSNMVAGRTTLFRVWVEPTAQWTPQRVRLKLTIERNGQNHPFEVEQHITGPSNESDRSTVLEIQVPGEHITQDATFKAALHTEKGAKPDTGHDRARWPINGTTQPLNATTAPGVLKVVLVPLHFEKNNTTLKPDTSPEQLARFQVALESTFPVTKVELTVRDAIPWDRSLNFGNINSEMRALKSSDMAEAETFYYGLIRPDVDFASYCSGRCTTGQSFTVSKASATSYFVGSGVGFTGDRWAWTLVHEMGHMHGRGHASCGVSFFSQDRQYPHSGGDVGAWGWDKRSNTLWAPDKATDFMGYCDTLWVSDYTYDGIYKRRVEIVQHTALRHPFGKRTTWRALTWGDKMQPQWSSPSIELYPGTGEVSKVTFYKGQSVLSNKDLPKFKMSHDGVAGLMIDRPPAGATHIAIEIKNKAHRIALPASF